MKVAFIVRQVEYSIPLGVAYCAAVLKERGFECRVFEAGIKTDKSVGEVVEYAPDVVGATVISGTHRSLVEFFRTLKRELEFVGIFGGPHPTFFPEIVAEPGIDAVCRGEGELALAEFMEKYRDRGDIPSDVDNFWIKRNGRVEKRPVRPLITDPDSLPYPDRTMFIKKYPVTDLHGIKHFIAHRGCPYRCTFCFNHAYNRMYGVSGADCYHSRRPESVCAEINVERSRMNVKMVSFVDDCFTLNKSWTIDFCEIYRREVGLPFQINTRVEHLDADCISALAAANCWLIHVGVESGDEEYRRRVLNRRMSNEDLVRVIKDCRQAGIKVLTENMVGLPTETYQQALKTLSLNIAAAPDFAAVSYFTPYPGLELTKYAIEQGVYDGGVDDFPENYMHYTLLSFRSEEDKRRLVNLRSFFNLGVRHPRLWPLYNRLTNLPPNRLFRTLGDLADGYYLWRLIPRRTGVRDFLRLFRQYLLSYRKVVNRWVGN